METTTMTMSMVLSLWYYYLIFLLIFLATCTVSLRLGHAAITSNSNRSKSSASLAIFCGYVLPIMAFFIAFEVTSYSRGTIYDFIYTFFILFMLPRGVFGSKLKNLDAIGSDDVTTKVAQDDVYRTSQQQDELQKKQQQQHTVDIWLFTGLLFVLATFTSLYHRQVAIQSFQAPSWFYDPSLAEYIGNAKVIQWIPNENYEYVENSVVTQMTLEWDCPTATTATTTTCQYKIDEVYCNYPDYVYYLNKLEEIVAMTINNINENTCPQALGRYDDDDDDDDNDEDDDNNNNNYDMTLYSVPIAGSCSLCEAVPLVKENIQDYYTRKLFARQAALFGCLSVLWLGFAFYYSYRGHTNTTNDQDINTFSFVKHDG